MFKKGQIVKQAFGAQEMRVVDFDDDLIENVVTEWEDGEGNVVTAKFMEDQLQLVANQKGKQIEE